MKFSRERCASKVSLSADCGSVPGFGLAHADAVAALRSRTLAWKENALAMDIVQADIAIAVPVRNEIERIELARGAAGRRWAKTLANRAGQKSIENFGSAFLALAQRCRLVQAHEGGYLEHCRRFANESE